MASKRIVRTNKKRIVNTYAELRHTANCLFNQGICERKGSDHQFLASLIFTAFTMEAYLNHLGEKIFKLWTKDHRWSPDKKLKTLEVHLNVKIDKCKCPGKTLKELLDFRKLLAHGMSLVLEDSEDIPLDKYSDDYQFPEFIKTKWQEYCTKENAEKAREDIDQIMRILHAAAGLNVDRIFCLSSQSSHTQVIKEQ